MGCGGWGGGGRKGAQLGLVKGSVSVGVCTIRSRVVGQLLYEVIVLFLR